MTKASSSSGDLADMAAGNVVMVVEGGRREIVKLNKIRMEVVE